MLIMYNRNLSGKPQCTATLMQSNFQFSRIESVVPHDHPVTLVAVLSEYPHRFLF